MTFHESDEPPEEHESAVDDGVKPTFARILSTTEPLSAGQFCAIWVGLWVLAGLPVVLLQGVHFDGPLVLVQHDTPLSWILSGAGMVVGWWACACRLATIGYSRLLSAVFFLPILNVWLVVVGAMHATPKPELEPAASERDRRSATSWLAAYLAGAAVFIAHAAFAIPFHRDPVSGFLMFVAPLAMGFSIAFTLGVSRPATIFESLVVSFSVVATAIVVLLCLLQLPFAIALVLSVLQTPVAAILSVFVLVLAMLASPLFLLGAAPG